MRSWILSAVVAAAATGQPPATSDPKPPAKGSVEDAILNAQRNHPDIKLAEAKLRMAEAEVEQARFQVAQRVATAFGKVEQAKVVMKLTSERATVLENLRKQGGVGLASFEMTQAAKLAALNAKADLAAAELELKAATGAALRYHSPATDTGVKASVGSPPAAGGKPLPVGAVADKLKALIDKPVKLDLKAADLDEAMAALLKAAGAPAMTMKLPMFSRKYLKQPPTVTFSGELPFTAAVQFILDEVNAPLNGDLPDIMRGPYDVYVREYGLLVARVTDAPNDAPTLTEFARQVRAEKAAKK
jgi:hypothetical protein